MPMFVTDSYEAKPQEVTKWLQDSMEVVKSLLKNRYVNYYIDRKVQK